MSWLVLACAAAMSLAASPASAQVQIQEVVVGFDGSWKVGQWTPIRALVKSPKASRVLLQVSCVDADENLTTNPSEVHTVAAGQAWIYGSFKAGRLQGDLHVEIADSEGRRLAASRLQNGVATDGTMWTWKPPLRLDELLWVAIGEPGGLAPLAQPGPQERPVTVANTTPEHLPRLAHMWAGVDACVLAARPKLLRNIDPRQNLALRDWVRRGGHLFVGVGGDSLSTVLEDRAPPFVRPVKEQKPLPVADWVPISASGSVDLRQLSGLESFVGQAAPLRFTGALLTPRLGEIPDATTLITAPTGALLVRIPFGFGRITFLGVDFSQPPLANWPPLTRLYRRVLIDRHGVAQKRPEGTSVQLSRSGRSDLATQLHGAQETFSPVERPSYWTVMVGLLLVLVVVGPLDYLIVTRWLQKPAWTWVTLPLLVVAICGAFHAMGVASNGMRRLVNTLDVVDVDVASGTVRGQSWLTVYNPAAGRFDVTAEPENSLTPAETSARRRPAESPPDPVQRETMLSWTSIPEESLGGLYRQGGTSLTQRRYAYDGATAGLLNVPVSQWSTRSLVAEWTQTARVSEESTLERTGLGRLSGSFAHRLPGQLEHVILVHGGHVYVPPGSAGRLSPGQVWRPGNARGIKSTLTNARTIPIYQSSSRSKAYLVQPEPYDAYDSDRDALVRMLSFHEGADGSKYTGLQHAPLGRLEMTPLLDLNRAVLIGRLKTPVMSWRIDGSPIEPTERHTFVRLVLPVAQAKATQIDERPFLGADRIGSAGGSP